MNKLAAAIERIEQTLEHRADSNWNEADHPRAANGQFGSGGGGTKKRKAGGGSGGEAPKSSTPTPIKTPLKKLDPSSPAIELPLSLERQLDALSEMRAYRGLMDAFWEATHTSQQNTIGGQQKAVQKLLSRVSEWPDTDPVKKFGNKLKKLFEIEGGSELEPPKPVEVKGAALRIARERERPPAKNSMFRTGN